MHKAYAIAKNISFVLKKVAYPYNINKNPVEYNEMVMALAADLSLEIVLLSAAADKGVIVTDMEIDLAEKEFKKDYPVEIKKEKLQIFLIDIGKKEENKNEKET